MVSAAAVVVEVVVELLGQRSNSIGSTSASIRHREGITGVVEDGAGDQPIVYQNLRPGKMRDFDGVVGADVVPRIVVRVAVVLFQDVRIDLADGINAEGIKTAVGAGIQRMAINVVELAG